MSDTRVATRPYIIGPASTSFVVPASSFTGPGDIFGAAVGWWGLRAFSAATRGTAAIRLRRSSDLAQGNISTDAVTGALNTSDPFFDGSATYNVVTVFDQSGNGHDQTIGAIGTQVTLVLAALGSLPVIRCNTGGGGGTLTATLSGIVSQIFSTSHVANNTGVVHTGFFGDVGTAGAFYSLSNGFRLFAGASATAVAATDNTAHAIQCLFNTSTSAAQVDSTLTNSLNPGTSGMGPSVGMGGFVGQDNWDGDVTEFGVWNGDKTANFNSMHTNQSTYYGTP